MFKAKFFLLAFLVFTLLTQAQKKNVKKNVKSERTIASIYTTAENTTLKLSAEKDLVFENAKQPVENEISIFVNDKKKFQKFMGIGGAITDASAEVFAKLSAKNQQKLLNAYYSKSEGIGYSILRTTIGSCDFSSNSYTYISEGDFDLKTFDIAPDLKFKVPMIKRALATAKDLTIYVSPWSPPAFMKSNNNVLQGGSLLPRFYQSYANFYVKFIKEYEKIGIPIWGLTIQNEPMATQRWESCIYTAEQERDFLKYNLGPTLAKNNLGDKKIIVWDHNRDLISQRADVIFSDPEASKYAWGIGFHWYETWAGGQPMYENLQIVNESYPTKNILFTEGCAEKFDANKYYFWANAERYGSSMINDFNNGTVGWTDWNILLDQNGGPNHVGNFCFAPVHADTTTDELIFTPSYYYIGHFSKFIEENARRISTTTSRSDITATSFQNSDGKIITVVMNAGAKAVVYNLYIGNKKTTTTIPKHGIQTILY